MSCTLYRMYDADGALLSRPCGYCGAGIIGSPSAVRIDGKLTTVHAECRRQVLDAQRIVAKDDRRAAREERRNAIIRGDIA